MSELDKAISELVSAFQAKPETDAKATGRQKYMADQSIRTKERSTIANLQGQVRDLTATVQRKNREILALKEALDNRVSEHRVAIAELRERDSKSKERAVLNNEPAKMATPLGLLPIDSTGMRRLADAYAQIASLYNHRAADQSTMAEKNAALQKENDAYEALFRVLAETLREYDPKVKS